MTGHESIIKMRMNGFAPQSVWVHVLNAEPEYLPCSSPEESLRNGFCAEIHITPMSRSALDFRCLTGLVIHLQGDDENRVLQILKQIERFEPKRVITSLPNLLLDSGEKI